MKLQALVDDISGNVAISCAECGDVVLVIETAGNTDTILQDHKHGTERIFVRKKASR